MRDPSTYTETTSATGKVDLWFHVAVVAIAFVSALGLVWFF